MAREKMVTRTIVSTQAECLICNLDTGATEKVVMEIAGTYKDSKSLLKAVEKAGAANEREKVVNAKQLNLIEKLYGMKEQDFIKLAQELPARVNNKMNV